MAHATTARLNATKSFTEVIEDEKDLQKKEATLDLKVLLRVKFKAG